MADDVKVTNLHDSGSPARVALDLAYRIAEKEHPRGTDGPGNPREYWLDLFADALYAANGYRDAKSR